MGALPNANPPDKRVQVKIEVGHQAISKENPTNLFTHDWTTFVRGAEGADISHFVDKVVFHLHESFPKPKRICKEPPFKVSEQGYGSFTLPIEIYFRNKEEPRKYSVNYELTLQLRGLPPLNCTKVEALTFLNPSEEFEKKLINGGAVVLSPGVSKRPTANEDTPSSTKPKKKKNSEKHEVASGGSGGSSSTPSNPVPKEISILGASGDVDPLKPKNMNSIKKLKDDRQRRKSVEEVPKSTPKESKCKTKDVKSKKEKKSERKPSPTGSEGIAPAMKFTIKRTLDESWSATVSHKSGSPLALGSFPDQQAIGETTATLPEPNITTASQQNDLVNKVMAQFAEEDESSDDNMLIDDDKSDIKRTPDQLLSSSLSSVDSVSGSSKTKKTKPQKSILSRGKGIKENDKKTRSEQTKTKSLVPLSSQEMSELFKKLNEIQDADLLQGVVDIVESSGQFDISSTTFDFDLCALEVGTVSAIKQFLEKS